jgi:hypothetical protein
MRGAMAALYAPNGRLMARPADEEVVTLIAAQAAVTIERWGATRRSSTGFVGSGARRTHARRPRGARRPPASRSRRPSPARADRRPEGARLRPRSIRRVSRCRHGRRGCRRPDRLRRPLRVQEHSRPGARKERAHRLGPRRSRGRPGQCAPSQRTGGTLHLVVSHEEAIGVISAYDKDRPGPRFTDDGLIALHDRALTAAETRRAGCRA